jgi:hypothetical protein
MNLFPECVGASFLSYSQKLDAGDVGEIFQVFCAQR